MLSERGLRAALEALVTRAPLPVALAAEIERLPAPIEATTYYVVAEALTNIAKYAQARVGDGHRARVDPHSAHSSRSATTASAARAWTATAACAGSPTASRRCRAR